MDDKLRAMLKTLESAPPPAGMKARVMNRLIHDVEVELNRAQRFVFTNPLRAAGIIAVAVSGLLWAIMGSNYPVILASIIFAR